MKLLKDYGLKNQRVLLRVGFNVPVENGQIANDFRIKATLPTIEYLLENEARIIIATHFGRPKGKVVEELRVDMIGQRLSELIKKPVKKLNQCVGAEVEGVIAAMEPGEIVLLENVQFHPGETTNSIEYAKSLAKLADYFVLDAFDQAHRNYASIAGVPKLLPSCAGLLLEKELSVLSSILHQPERPFVVIIGGAKISTKMKMIKKLLQTADDIILGGALANTVIWAKGIGTGKSIIEEGMKEELEGIDLTNNKLHIPVDVIASTDPKGEAPIRIVAVGKTREDEMILDIGPDTALLYSGIIKEAKMILWNGPMGLFEVEAFAHGSEAIAKAMIKSRAYTVTGGGDSISFLEKYNLFNKINHVSVGGGAMLQFLAGETLPGIAALESET